MDGLDVVRVVISSCCSHSPWLDVVGYDLAAVGERFVADSALSALFGDFTVEQLAHLGW